MDVYADVFVTFAGLNPSLIAAPKTSPTYRAVADYQARTLGHHVT